MQCWLSLAGFLLDGKLGCPELSKYLLARDQRAARGDNMFTDGNILYHTGSLCAGSCEIEHPVVRGWCGPVTSFPVYGEPQMKVSGNFNNF